MSRPIIDGIRTAHIPMGPGMYATINDGMLEDPKWEEAAESIHTRKFGSDWRDYVPSSIITSWAELSKQKRRRIAEHALWCAVEFNQLEAAHAEFKKALVS